MGFPLIHYLYPSGLPKYLYQNERGENSWALVTGSSDGIGLALCDELSSRGFNVVLHGRNQAKLDRCREDLERKHPKQSFRTVAADATKFTTEDIQRMVAAVADVPLTMLVNNVGGTAALHTNFFPFEDTSPEEMEALFRMNVQFPMQLTNALLPRFMAMPTPTLILNHGSMAQYGSAWMAAYAGCKAAVHAWSRSLAAEQIDAKTKVEVLLCMIGGTYTQQLQSDPNFKAGRFMPHAETMAKSILARVGHGHRTVVPYFWHWVQVRPLYALLPYSTVDDILAGIMKQSVVRLEK